MMQEKNSELALGIDFIVTLMRIIDIGPEGDNSIYIWNAKVEQVEILTQKMKNG